MSNFIRTRDKLIPVDNIGFITLEIHETSPSNDVFNWQYEIWYFLKDGNKYLTEIIDTGEGDAKDEIAAFRRLDDLYQELNDLKGMR